MMNHKAVILLLISAFLLGTDHVMQKIVLNYGVSPLSFAFTRLVLAVFFMTPYFLHIRKKKKFRFNKKNIRDLLIIGILGSCLSVLLKLLGLQYTTATNAGFMQVMVAVFTIIFSYFLLKERLPRLFFTIFFIMVIGIALISTNGGISPPNIGDLILLGNVCLWGFTQAFSKRTMRFISSRIMAYARIVIGMVFMSFLIPFFGLDPLIVIIPAFGWIVLSAISFAVRGILIYKAIDLENASHVMTFLLLAPVITLVFAHLWLNETLVPMQYVGAFLIFFGAIILTMLKPTKSYVQGN